MGLKNTKLITKPHEGSSGPQSPSAPPAPPASNPNDNIWNFPITTRSTTTQRPTTTTTTTRRTTTTTTTRRPWTTPSPFYNPSNPGYGGGGSGNYGNRFGDDTTFGGFNRPTTRPTTRRPSSSSSSSGSLDGFLSGIQNALGGDFGKFLGSALANRGGSSSGGGSSGLGGFFNTRPTETRRYGGGLFNENTGTSTNNLNAYPVTRYGDASPTYSSPTQAPSHGNFGWKLT